MKGLIKISIAISVCAAGPLAETVGSQPWMSKAMSPRDRARSVMTHMTAEEKRGMLYGYGCQTKEWPYTGNVAGIPRLNVPALKYNDGPQGFRHDAIPGSSTSWPSGLTAAASWDSDTMYAWGSGMGKEFYDKGANVQLGPGLCVARVPLNGRNFEYLSGEDPFLGYSLVQPVIQAIQSQGVVANAKHWVNNNQETNRDSVSENVDERTRFEMYYPPFEGAIKANVGSMMCSYNKINHVYSCENNETLMTDLKTRLGFQGYVMSDWGATHSVSIEQGLDQQMGDNTIFNQISLRSQPQEAIDESVVRILTGFFAVGVFDKPNPNNITNNVTSIEHNTMAQKISENSTVLLKNLNGALPLKKTNLKVIVVGKQSWQPTVFGGGSGHVVPAWTKPPLWAICDALGVDRIEPSSASKLSNCNSENGNCVTYNDGSKPSPSSAPTDYDVAILFIQTSSSEGSDRSNLLFGDGQDDMVSSWGKLQGAGFKKIVVMSTPGAVLTPWTDGVDAMLLNFMPGQAMADAVANILFGDVNPSGKLPLTFPNKENEQGMTVSQYPGVDSGENATYSEGFFFGYRWYDKNKVEPKYPFGHGLSYTTFSYGKLSISGRTVTCEITNTGNVEGSEVVQLYVGFRQRFGKDQREEPVKQLKGFKKTRLLPQETAAVTFMLTDRDLSFWDIEAKQWALKVGKADIYVGTSSGNIAQTGVMNVVADDSLIRVMV